MRKKLGNSEREVLGKIKRVMCVITHSLCVLFDAFERSVETSEVLPVFKEKTIVAHCQ